MSNEKSTTNQITMNSTRRSSPLDDSSDGSSGNEKKEINYSTEAKTMPPVRALPLRKRMTLESAHKMLKTHCTHNIQSHPPSSVEGRKQEEDRIGTVHDKDEENKKQLIVYAPTSNIHSSSIPTEHYSSPKRSLDETLSEGETTETDEESEHLMHRLSAHKIPHKKYDIKQDVKMALPGNPLLWNNGIKKNDMWSTESTIDAFKSAWLDNNKVVKKSKRGRPPLSKHNSDYTKNSNNSDSVTQHGRKNMATKSRAEGKLYCICQQPYDARRFMIACDSCDEWFHGECIGISEPESEFVDCYFCTDCSKATGKTTTWKPKCANPACNKAARISTHLGHVSKYCSDSCGMQVARARLELAEMKRRTPSSDPNESLLDLTLRNRQQLRVNSLADKDDRKRLIQLKDSVSDIRTEVNAIRTKDKFMKLLLQSQSQLGHNNRKCGYDSRLTWPNTYWMRIKEEPKLVNNEVMVTLDKEEPYGVCQSIGCNKHLNWQKLVIADIEHEKNEQYNKLVKLDKERNQIRTRLKKRRSREETVQSLTNISLMEFQ